MSESEEPKKPHKFSVASGDFIRFLEEKTPESQCPSCNSNTWTLIADSERDMAFRIVVTIKDGQKPTYLNCLAIFCNNCGLVRQHMARVVSTWVSENPPQEQEELDLEDKVDDNLI